ncbi:hypothetical protein BG011_009458 [Mortierella polycephala]|uniref:Crinkler effector protein N-terminal domain-containing protein n=1 Tax=Mortierella polycephala TaxID=41804 RepID=A0A9P6TW54_9FUNG|nr:hypothetical protein BG011_009458 [Mortierella polycephala]
MADLNLFCLIDGEPVSRAFSVKIAPALTVSHLRDPIKAEKPVGFRDVAANYLTVWHVSVPVTSDDKGLPITLNALVEKKKLHPVTKISKVFDGGAPKKSINIIVQRPSPADAPLHALTYPSSGSRPSTLFSGKVVGANVKNISDKFFRRGSSVAVFLDSFVRGQAMLPTTSGDIHGLPRAWRRSIAKPMEERPNLLFLDLPGSSATGTASISLASASLLNKMENSHSLLLPVFDVSGCGKTRAVLEVLSQRWGFYFNASGDDWGSNDMSTLQSVVKKHLEETRMDDTDDRYINNSVARKVTFLLFASRLLILEYCLNVPDCSETFTNARWTLLQVCPHVLFEDIFNLLFTALLELQQHCEAHLMYFVRKLFNETKTRLVQHGGMPKVKSDTKLPVFLDEAQVFGDAFDGSFVSVSSDRPLLSPILQGFDFIGHGQLMLVTCGTGTSVNTIFWPKSSGPNLKHGFGSRFPYMGFQRWTDQRSIKAYISRIRGCLPDDDSRRALDERFPQAAIDMLFKRLSGRLHPIVVAVEAIIRGNEQGAWQAAINGVEDRLVSWEKRDVKGNLCFELSQVREKWVKDSSQFEDSLRAF